MKPRNALFVALLLLLLSGALEIFSYAAGRALQAKWAMWRVPIEPDRRVTQTFEEYRRVRDPVLGWPRRAEYGAHLDRNGAHRNPAFPDGARRGSCISLYGDSFTVGGDTTSQDRNWGNVLSVRVGCYVANFGMGGYGTDQAYLRFVGNTDDPAPVVIFGFHTADASRNLTRVRDLENGERWFALKPRFILRDGALELVPIPDLSEAQYLRAIGARGELLPLEHESLQPGGPAGAVKLAFPYTVAVARNVLGYYVFRARVLRRPPHMELLRAGHPLQGLEITVAITQAFVHEAERRGKAPLVAILPHAEDLGHFERTGIWPYADVTEAYRRERIPFVDFGPALSSLAEQQERPTAAYFGETGHYDDEANRQLAIFLHGALIERGLLAQPR